MSAEALDSMDLAREMIGEVIALLQKAGKLRPEQIVAGIKAVVDEWAIAPVGATIAVDFARRPVDVSRPAEVVSARSLLERILRILEAGAGVPADALAWRVKREVSRWDIVLPTDAAFGELRRRLS